MKKILVFLFLVFTSIPVYAGMFASGTGNNGYPDTITCSTTTATVLFLGDGYEKIVYDNQTSGTIYLSTSAVTSATRYTYPLLTGKSIAITNTNYKYGLAVTTTNAVLNLLLDK